MRVYTKVVSSPNPLVVYCHLWGSQGYWTNLTLAVYRLREDPTPSVKAEQNIWTDKIILLCTTSSFTRFSYFCVYVGAWTTVLPEWSAISSRLAHSSLMASALARRRVSPSSRDSLARASLMTSALAHRRISPSSQDSLARASLMASALARRRVSPSSRDSLARASLMASALAHRRVSPSQDSLTRASLMASALARRQVSPSSRDSLARASLMASALARRRVSFSSGLPGRRGIPYRYVNMQLTRPDPTLQAGLTIPLE